MLFNRAGEVADPIRSRRIFRFKIKAPSWGVVGSVGLLIGLSSHAGDEQ
jgi:hypothetical protein